MYRTILVEDAGPIGRLTLNRPDKRNPIGPATCGELVHALAALGARAEVRVVILTGAGAAFSAGGDLAMRQAGAGDAPAIPPASLVDLLLAMHGLGKPIVAMVNGPALAGGLGLMVACDLVVAADSAVFGTTEIAVGLWPMMITAEITRSVGRKKTLEMMLTGRKLDAAEALACGLVNRVVPAAELETHTVALATELAGRSPAAVRTSPTRRSCATSRASSARSSPSRTPPRASRRSSASARRCGRAGDGGRRDRSRPALDHARR
jgi:enoyl-CoA hydratase/carnithine racemase